MSKKLVPNTNLSESVRKDLRAATLALGVIRATKEGFEVDTSVVNGTSATQGDGAGALSTGVNDGQVNQSSSDAGSQTSLNNSSDDPNLNGTDNTPVPSGDGVLDTNGGDLGSIREQFSVGQYVAVVSKGRQIDSGIVEAVDPGKSVTILGEKYDFDKFRIVALA